MKRLTALLALLVLLAAPALADPASDLKSAFAKLAAAKSYRVSTVSPSGPAVTSEIVNPGRLHTVMGPMEVIVIDNTTYMKMGGKWQKQTSPANAGGEGLIAQSYAHIGSDWVIRDLGMKAVAGAVLHAYSVQKDASTAPATIFVGSDGMVAQIQSAGPRGTIAMRFSDFNAPITIVAPI